MQIIIPVPRNFNFKRTVLSHGWCSLPPFELDSSKWILNRVLTFNGGRTLNIKISSIRNKIKVTIPGGMPDKFIEKVIEDVRHMLRLDDDMEEFYSLISGDPEFDWIAKEGMGRLLRSPTVFEDLVKMICTTNCSWSLTEKMVNGLVDALGTETPDGKRSFPGPSEMAGQSEDFFRNRIRAGYRAPFLKELADRAADGSIDVEGWLASDLPATQLKKEIMKVKGAGPYAAENMLKLLGRYDGLALDSWLRSKFTRVRNKGRPATDKKIEKYYSKFGEWRGLVLWCDMTRDWLDEEQRLVW